MPLEISDTFFTAVKWFFGQPIPQMTYFTFVRLYSSIPNVPVPNVNIFPQKDSWDVLRRRDRLLPRLAERTKFTLDAAPRRGLCEPMWGYTTFAVIFLSQPQAGMLLRREQDAQRCHSCLYHMHWITQAQSVLTWREGKGELVTTEPTAPRAEGYGSCLEIQIFSISSYSMFSPLAVPESTPLQRSNLCCNTLHSLLSPPNRARKTFWEVPSLLHSASAALQCCASPGAPECSMENWIHVNVAMKRYQKPFGPKLPTPSQARKPCNTAQSRSTGNPSSLNCHPPPVCLCHYNCSNFSFWSPNQTSLGNKYVH